MYFQQQYVSAECVLVLCARFWVCRCDSLVSILSCKGRGAIPDHWQRAGVEPPMCFMMSSTLVGGFCQHALLWGPTPCACTLR